MTKDTDPKKMIGRIMYVKDANTKNGNLQPVLIFVDHTGTNKYNFYYNVYYIKEKVFQNVGYDHETIKGFISSYEQKRFTPVEINFDYVWMII